MTKIRFAYTIGAIHLLGGLALLDAAIINGWPWPVYLVAALALAIALVIAAVSSDD